MAYAAAITYTNHPDEQGRLVRVVTIAETDASSAAGAEWELQDVPELITITSYKATLTAGTGATIQPKLGRVTGWTSSTQDDLAVQASASAHHNDNTILRLRTPNGSLFGHSQANNAATDHVISTEIVYLEGHWPS